MKIKITYKGQEYYVWCYKHCICNSQVFPLKGQRNKNNSDYIEHKPYSIVEVSIFSSPLFQKYIPYSKEYAATNKIKEKYVLHKTTTMRIPIVAK